MVNRGRENYDFIAEIIELLKDVLGNVGMGLVESILVSCSGLVSGFFWFRANLWVFWY